VFSWLFDLKSRAAARGLELVDLGIGSPDLPTPSRIIDELSRAVHDPRHHGYPPFRGTAEFLHAASRFVDRRFGVSLDASTQIQCVSGAEEGFTHLAMGIVQPGEAAVMGDIHYPIHARSVQLAGGEPVFVGLGSENGFLPDLDEVERAFVANAGRVRMFILNYPHNPTGATCTLEFMERAVALCRAHNVVLVSDLAYSELTFDGYRARSVLEVRDAVDVAIELHSFSKSFNMAGFRIAFAAGNAETISRLYSIRSNCTYGTPTSIQHAAAFALDHAEAMVPEVVGVYAARRNAVAYELEQNGCPVRPPLATMFVWAPVPDGHTSQSWAQALIEEAGVVVTPGDAFGPGGNGWFRISLVAEPEVLRDAVARMGRLAPGWCAR
jgi:LL-diaminopimelate aminotransferase